MATKHHKRRIDRGFSLVEVLVAATILAFALLAAASSTIAGHNLAKTEATHSAALATTRAFTERLRADLDWPTLYERLRDQEDAEPEGSSPNALYDDFEAASQLRDVRILARVPRGQVFEGGDPFLPSTTTNALREDVVEPGFGLPYDLSGDGTIDAESHDEDYLSLPVVVELAWTGATGPEQRMSTLVWLRGERR